VRRLQLTADGEALARQGQAIQHEVIATMVAGSTAAELATLTDAMQRASVALQGLLQGEAD
jgi:DNA-binding MarR family transcriptional regulator